MSRPTVGSSRKSSGGRPQIASANCTCRFWPAESFRVWPVGERPECRSASSVCAGRQRLRVVARREIDQLADAQLGRQSDFLHHHADVAP